MPSSPLSTPPSSDSILKQNSQSNPLPQYRRARELPFELAQHAQTYYEENLFTGAFNFLISIVSNSISASNPSLPVIVPPPSHLSVAATLAIHPILTTRTTIREKWDQANSAFRLLKLVLTTVGPINSKFSEAFKFKKYESRSSRIGGRDYDDYGNQQNDTSSTLNLRFAESDSVWSRAEDFWHTVGWALNCSCLPDMHAARWQHWQLYLSFMIDGLERDWELHYYANTTEESIIWQYIELASGGYGRSRRIMRAIFADGGTRSLNEFREVFHNELKPPSPKETGIKKREVDVKVDKDVFGDYLDPDDSDASDSQDNFTQPGHTSKKRARTRTPSTRRTAGSRTSSRASSRSSQQSDQSPHSASSSQTATTLGPPTALTLRVRLLHLLSHISGHPTLTSTSPTTFPDLGELYTLFVEWIKPLPLPLFQQIISPSTTTTPSSTDIFSLDAHTTLCEVILQRSLESAAPAIRSEKFLTKDKLTSQYLPYAASGASVVEQAKVSLLLEALLRRSSSTEMLKAADKDELLAAVGVGVSKREEVARERMGRTGSKKKKEKKSSGGKDDGSGEEERREREAWQWLVESGMRMRVVVELLE